MYVIFFFENVFLSGQFLFFSSFRHLPSTLLESFVKNLSRLSLMALPAAIVMGIPFTYNISKCRPALMVMVHRVDAEMEENGRLPSFLSSEFLPVKRKQFFIFNNTLSWTRRKMRCRRERWISIDWIIRIIRYVPSSSSRARYFKCSRFVRD